MRIRILTAFLAALSMVLLVITGASSSSTVLAQTDPTPRPLYALPDARTPVYTSSTIAFSEPLGVVVTANMLGDSVSIMAPGTGELRAQIIVADDPRSVAITPDGLRALVTSRRNATLTIIDINQAVVTQVIPLGGGWAYGVVAATNTTAYVTLQNSNEVVAVNLTRGEITARIPTPAVPTGMALWGDFLYITHLWSGEVSLIYLPQAHVVNTINTGTDTGLSPSITIDRTRGEAYLPQSRSNAANPALTYDTVIFPVVNVLALNGLSLQRANRITPNTAARPVNMPFAVALDPFRRWAYIANAGSNDITIINIDTNRAVATLDVGANPRGLVLNADGSRLFVHNVIDATVNIIDTTTQTIQDSVPINPNLNIPIDIVIGAELFHTARDPRLSEGRWVSCANCHFDGMSDGRVWQDFPDGARNTPPLFDLRNTAPYTWAGAWDELQDTELKIRSLQGGDGLLAGNPNDPLDAPHAGLSLDLDTLTIYLDTLRGISSPYPTDTPIVARGETIFDEQGCATCHIPPTGTDRIQHDVGTGGTFDTPTLRWLWMTAPYFHDGSAKTLTAVFTQSGAHQLSMTLSIEEIEALVSYLLTLPAN